MMAGQNPDLQAPQPYTKEQANYRHYESCRTCANYNGRVGCSQVQGHVSPEAVCDHWTMQESTMHISNKEVITKEYEKSMASKEK